MDNIYAQFSLLLEAENKEAAVELILDKLKKKELDILDLYLNILTPTLNQMTCTLEEKHICIWKEHVRTAIVRTIVECCYPYVIEKREEMNVKGGETVVVLCPPEEYHDLGARMVSDFFTIAGCHSIFVGSNTPYEDFFNAIHVIRPSVVAISVSDYYNLVVTKKIIKDLKGAMDYPLKVVVGGSALKEKEENYKLVGADYYANTYEDIEKIIRSEVAK